MQQRNPLDSGQSRAEQVARQVEDEILQALLPEGAHLGRRAEFMQRFGISPLVMNETLRILRTRGLVGVRPGTGGGIFVANLPPQIRLGGMDLWFNASQFDPMALFEARVFLEEALTPVAFERADAEDVARMREALTAMSTATDAREFLHAVIALHRALVVASKVAVLDGMHDAIVTLLLSSLSRASFVDGHEAILGKSMSVHRSIVKAIAAHDRPAFDRIIARHNDDLIRPGDRQLSPKVPTSRTRAATDGAGTAVSVAGPLGRTLENGEAM